MTRRYTPDEKINMRLRREAGESIGSIAEDYECTHYTVRYWTEPEFAAHCRKQRNANYRNKSSAAVLSKRKIRIQHSDRHSLLEKASSNATSVERQTRR